MNLNKNVARQGDVLWTKVDALPAGVVELKTEDKRVVLAYGEVTFHSHSIYEDTDKVKMWAVGKVKYLEVLAGAKVTSRNTSFIIGVDGQPIELGTTELDGVCLKHEEHTHHVIPPGIYKLPVQVEYSPQELRITRD